MITDQDIKRITEAQKQDFYTKSQIDDKFASWIPKMTDYMVMVLRDIFATKEDLKLVEIKIDSMANAMDSIVKDNKIFREEMASLNYRVKHTEDWIDKSASKMGIKFDH